MTLTKEDKDFLAHYGVLGMKWGVRRSQAQLDRAAGRPVSRRTDRRAKKDAKETARAKMYYGEGAGTRRKLQKAKVESRSKDSSYKKAYEKHLAEQDLGKHAKKAKGERRRANVKGATKKTGKGIAHVLKGNPQYASVAATLAAGGLVAAHKAGATEWLKEHGQKTISDIQGTRQYADMKEKFLAWQLNRKFG